MSELPEGWETTALIDLVTFNPKHQTDTDRDQVISFVPMPSVDEHTGTISEPKERLLSETWKGFTHFANGDVIFAKITPCMENGKSAIARDLKNGIACGSTEFHVLRPSEGILAEYLWRYLSQKSFRIEAAKHMTGAVGQRRVPKPYLEQLAFPLPPLAEQRRIVEQLDQLSARTRAAKDHLAHVQTLATRAKQATLAAAFRGELTADWRVLNDHPVAAPASDATAHHKAEIDAWETALEDWETSGRAGKRPAKPRKSKPPEVLSEEQTKLMWDLPVRWAWVQIGEGAFVTKLAGFEYTKLVNYTDEGDLSVLKAENVGLNGFRPTDYSKVVSMTVSSLTRSQIFGGEVLVVFVGAGVGNVGAVPEGARFFLGPNIGMVRPYGNGLNSKFLEYFLRSRQGKDLLLAEAKAVAQPSISMGAIRNTPVPICSDQEQSEIVRRIEAAFARIDRMVTEATRAAELLERLEQQLLAKAFRGELVSQDPADEPASALLARVREARAKAPKPKRTRKRAKT